MQNYINDISNNPIARLFIILLSLDVFIGSLRAIKERNWNSTVGINRNVTKSRNDRKYTVSSISR